MCVLAAQDVREVKQRRKEEEEKNDRFCSLLLLCTYSIYLSAKARVVKKWKKNEVSASNAVERLLNHFTPHH